MLFNVGDWTQDLVYDKQALWIASPASFFFFNILNKESETGKGKTRQKKIQDLFTFPGTML